ncbi:hypothetical protein BDV34DRAFT_195262 [Aspergillus parasiticus]|uniref:Uncharacterized protein n=1 Tax=Aspergillus parasiticus TaxID=5067 RepID=A0A5N6DL14_ASPPA|nr:hypothetical protein BDV34DRAFT_195262 [Aspergillus parasiticus]
MKTLISGPDSMWRSSQVKPGHSMTVCELGFGDNNHGEISYTRVNHVGFRRKPASREVERAHYVPEDVSEVYDGSEAPNDKKGYLME